jgi:hypothetical protein
MKYLNHLTIKVQLKFVYVTAINVILSWEVSKTDLLPDLFCEKNEEFEYFSSSLA